MLPSLLPLSEVHEVQKADIEILWNFCAWHKAKTKVFSFWDCPTVL